MLVQSSGEKTKRKKMLKWNKGDVIHREAPFIAMLTKDNIKQYCSYCFRILLGKSKLGKNY